MAIQSFASRTIENFFREGRITKKFGWATVSKIAARKLDILDYARVVLKTSISVTTIERIGMSPKKRRRPPTSPGEILKEEFLVPLGMTQKKLADHLECDVKVINRIVNSRTSVTAEMALKLGATFRTTPEFWLNAQKAVDLYRAFERLEKLPEPVLRAGRARISPRFNPSLRRLE